MRTLHDEILLLGAIAFRLSVSLGPAGVGDSYLLSPWASRLRASRGSPSPAAGQEVEVQGLVAGLDLDRPERRLVGVGVPPRHTVLLRLLVPPRHGRQAERVFPA